LQFLDLRHIRRTRNQRHSRVQPAYLTHHLLNIDPTGNDNQHQARMHQTSRLQHDRTGAIAVDHRQPCLLRPLDRIVVLVDHHARQLELLQDFGGIPPDAPIADNDNMVTQRLFRIKVCLEHGAGASQTR
jgi:hypothetical protein